MRVAELLEILRYSDIRSFGLTEKKSNKLLDAAYPIINVSLNRALRKVHTDFNLRQNSVIIQTRQGISRYYLRSQHSVLNGDPAYAKYILDTSKNPFKDNVVKILSVCDELGVDYKLNTVGAEFPVMIPEFDCVEMVRTDYEPAIGVIYQSTCDDVDITDKNLNIPIPTYIEEAFLIYLMYIVANMQTNALAQQKAQLLLLRYKDEVNSLKDSGIVFNQTQHITNAFDERGWK